MRCEFILSGTVPTVSSLLFAVREDVMIVLLAIPMDICATWSTYCLVARSPSSVGSARFASLNPCAE